MMIPFINNRLPLIIVFVFIFFSTAFSQDAPVVVDSAAVLKGEQIFKANCTSCHVMGDKKTHWSWITRCYG
jgi:cytochrome c2